MTEYFISIGAEKCKFCEEKICLSHCIQYLDHGEIVTKNCSSCKRPNIFRVNKDREANIMAFAKDYSMRFKKNELLFRIMKFATTNIYLFGKIEINIDKVEKKLHFSMKNVKDNLAEGNKQECVICYENCFTQTKCSHPICHDCYNKIKDTCPYCRQNINNNIRITIDVNQL